MNDYQNWKQKRMEKKHNLRATLLKSMDDYIREIVDDEELIEGWLMGGIPDGSEPEEFEDYADDSELWHDCIRLFSRIVRADEKGEE